MTPLSNRLAAYALHDLIQHAPKAILETENWDDQCGFWLAQLPPSESLPWTVSLQEAVSKHLDLPILYICEVKRILQNIAEAYRKGTAPCRNN